MDPTSAVALPEIETVVPPGLPIWAPLPLGLVRITWNALTPENGAASLMGTVMVLGDESFSAHSSVPLLLS